MLIAHPRPGLLSKRFAENHTPFDRSNRLYVAPEVVSSPPEPEDFYTSALLRYTLVTPGTQPVAQLQPAVQSEVIFTYSALDRS
jgi:hypothetical protein